MYFSYYKFQLSKQIAFGKIHGLLGMNEKSFLDRTSPILVQTMCSILGFTKASLTARILPSNTIYFVYLLCLV